MGTVTARVPVFLSSDDLHRASSIDRLVSGLVLTS